MFVFFVDVIMRLVVVKRGFTCLCSSKIDLRRTEEPAFLFPEWEMSKDVLFPVREAITPRLSIINYLQAFITLYIPRCCKARTEVANGI